MSEKTYRSVNELTPEELEELRTEYFFQHNVEFNAITDEMLFEHYAKVSFVEDDFFCDQNHDGVAEFDRTTSNT